MTVMVVPMASPDLPGHDPALPDHDPDLPEYDLAPRGLSAAPRDDRTDHLSDVYDPATLAAINAGVATGGGLDWRHRQALGSPAESRCGDGRVNGSSEGCRPGASRPAPGSTGTDTARTGRRGMGAVSLAGALWLGALTGLGEAFGDEDLQPHVGWWVPAATDPGTEAVSVHLVPGAPAASHVVVRQWLLAGH